MKEGREGGINAAGPCWQKHMAGCIAYTQGQAGYKIYQDHNVFLIQILSLG